MEEAVMTAENRILVIDDEEGIRRGIQRVLAHDGHEIVTAADGQEGIDRLRAEPFDLLLVDLKMPGPIDGLGVIQAALERDPLVIAVIISAYATLEAAVQATRMGAYDFLAKPFTPEELRITVHKGLERRQLMEERQRLMAERERNLLELSAERGRLKRVVNSMGDGVLVINQKGGLVYANPMATRILQIEKPLEGQPYGSILEKSRLAPQVERLLRAESEALDRISQEFEPDDATTIMANLTRVRDESGAPVGCVVVMRDISRLKELDRVKSRFVSVVSHELKAPLAAIEGYLEVLLAGTVGEVPDKGRAMLERCRDRAAGLQNLIKDILNITRIEAQAVTRNIERQAAPPVVTGVLDLLRASAEARRIELVHAAPDGLPPILVDRDDLERILTNLVSNAVKYNRDGGRVTVSYSAANGFLDVAVSDTGIGIDPEHQDQLGKEFFRVRNAETSRISGTGLGLSIVKKLMEFYHGRLTVKSVAGQGSTFVASFPLDGPIPTGAAC
jgi:PAS domain S-box-containing protein